MSVCYIYNMCLSAIYIYIYIYNIGRLYMNSPTVGTFILTPWELQLIVGLRSENYFFLRIKKVAVEFLATLFDCCTDYFEVSILPVYCNVCFIYDLFKCEKYVSLFQLFLCLKYKHKYLLSLMWIFSFQVRFILIRCTVVSTLLYIIKYSFILHW